jgi:hypothetical protein
MPFEPGQSGNPGGRPKERADVKELARSHAVAAIEVLAKIMHDDMAKHSARVSAATQLLDRALGKPVQEVTGSDGTALFGNVTITFVKPGEAE